MLWHLRDSVLHMHCELNIASDNHGRIILPEKLGNSHVKFQQQLNKGFRIRIGNSISASPKKMTAIPRSHSHSHSRCRCRCRYRHRHRFRRCRSVGDGLSRVTHTFSHTITPTQQAFCICIGPVRTRDSQSRPPWAVSVQLPLSTYTSGYARSRLYATCDNGGAGRETAETPSGSLMSLCSEGWGSCAWKRFLAAGRRYSPIAASPSASVLLEIKKNHRVS